MQISSPANFFVSHTSSWPPECMYVYVYVFLDTENSFQSGSQFLCGRDGTCTLCRTEQSGLSFSRAFRFIPGVISLFVDCRIQRILASLARICVLNILQRQSLCRSNFCTETWDHAPLDSPFVWKSHVASKPDLLLTDQKTPEGELVYILKNLFKPGRQHSSV